MTSSSRPALGIIEAPDVAVALELLGFAVIGGADFRQAAAAIRQHELADSMPVIAIDSARVGLRGWLTKQEALGARVVILRQSAAFDLPAELGRSVQLPAAVNDVMAAAGWGPSPHPLGQATIGVDVSVADLAPYRPAVVEPEPEPLPAPPVAEVLQAPPAPAVVLPAAPAVATEVPALPAWAQELVGPAEPAAEIAPAVSIPAPLAERSAVVDSVASAEDESWPVGCACGCHAG